MCVVSSNFHSIVLYSCAHIKHACQRSQLQIDRGEQAREKMKTIFSLCSMITSWFFLQLQTAMCNGILNVMFRQFFFSLFGKRHLFSSNVLVTTTKFMKLFNHFRYRISAPHSIFQQSHQPTPCCFVCELHENHDAASICVTQTMEYILFFYPGNDDTGFSIIKIFLFSPKNIKKISICANALKSMKFRPSISTSFHNFLGLCFVT